MVYPTDTVAFRAMQFARRVHAGQVRKYTGNPYSDHLAEVAGIVATVAPSYRPWQQHAMIATSWLHDCVEDQGVSLETIEDRFGTMVAIGVSSLSWCFTDTGNRAQRKAAARDRLEACSGWIQTIKVADLISNTSSIVQHDPKFARVYLREKRLLLDVLTLADPGLLEMAREQLAAACGRLDAIKSLQVRNAPLPTIADTDAASAYAADPVAALESSLLSDPPAADVNAARCLLGLGPLSTSPAGRTA